VFQDSGATAMERSEHTRYALTTEKVKSLLEQSPKLIKAVKTLNLKAV
jgi:hypothetical protein